MKLGFVIPIAGPAVSSAAGLSEFSRGLEDGRCGVGWLGVDGPAPAPSANSQDEGADRLWSIARRAAEDAGRDPDALKTAMRINLEPGTSVDSVADKLQRYAEAGVDEAYFDAFRDVHQP